MAGAIGVAAVAYASPAAAEETAPLNAAFWTPIQVVEEERSVKGFRLNFYGTNRNMTGFDLGLGNRVTGDLLGGQLGLVNIVHGNVLGGHYAFFANVVGKQTGGGASIVNWADDLLGGQLGVVNHAGKLVGGQLGFVNMSSDLKGVQVGLINIAKNGFLPVFPFFNFGT